jgi:hypothetical protein
MEEMEREMKNSDERTKKQNKNEDRKLLLLKNDFIHLQAVKVMEICQYMMTLRLKLLMS